METLVSVIMLVYNRERFVGEAIESVLSQTYRNLELIIVDDGSTDRTREIIEQFADTKIRYYPMPHTGVGSHMRNIAFSKTKGELIALIDSDDIWLPAKLEQQVKRMHEHPDMGLIFTNAVEFSDDGNILKSEIYPPLGAPFLIGNIFDNYVNNRFAIYPSTMMFRRSCCVSGTPWNERFNWTDNEFMHRIAFRYDAGQLDEKLVKIRKHNGNHSNAFPQEAINNMLPMIQSFYEEKMISRNTWRRMTAYYSYLSGLLYLQERSISSARSAFLQCVSIEPLHLKAWFRWMSSYLTRG